MAGLFAHIGCLFSKTARDNRDLYKLGYANKKKVVHTTIGWRRNPFEGNDGYTKTSREYTASGQDEYSYPLDWDDSERP